MAERSIGGWYSSDEVLKLDNRLLELRLQKAEWELEKERDGKQDRVKLARRRQVRTRVRGSFECGSDEAIDDGVWRASG